MRGTPFAEFDGLLKDADIILDVADMFSSEFLFSVSQLETYIACPFQFFSKYVLKLEPSERRDEIDEDFTDRGSKIHDMLERLEQLKRDSLANSDLEELERAALGEVLGREQVGASEVDLGLAEIEDRRLTRTMLRYRYQHEAYKGDVSASPVPLRFEVTFGEETGESHAYLELGRGHRSVRLRGKIDRIDLVDGPEGRGFRVIDYKSGHGPSTNDVRRGPDAPAPAVRDGRRADHSGW